MAPPIPTSRLDRRSGEPAVSVVMITRNRRESALRSVGRIAALRDQAGIIVVDNGSTDGTAAALSATAGVEVVAAGRNLGAAGRNVGAERARTPYVAFADDDSWWRPGAFTAAAEVLDAYPRLAVLVARTLVGPDERDDPLNAEFAAAPFGRSADLPGPTAVGFLACAVVVRRAAFLAVGGFHARYGVGGEEQLLALDLLARNWGVAYVDHVVARHDPAPGPERAGRRVRQLRNDLWTTWLRRGRRSVLHHTATVARQSVRDAAARTALVEAARGLPWVVRERSPVPRYVERLLAAGPA
jgi:GT2 family glycosyltransferase